ncbi:hypothetical protein STVA_27700 [Allostella vacuolata]|nr:hypothetical protein STVA_27700 [Stella vacuolata]
MTNRAGRAAALGALLAALPLAAAAQTVISANDATTTLQDGVVGPVAKPSPGTITVMRFTDGGVEAKGQLAVPTALAGLGGSVAVSRSEKLALVTSAAKTDPADAARQVPDDRVSVIDLTQSPPRLVQTIEAGAGASGVSFTPDDRLALVANHAAGTVSVFRVDGTALARLGTIALGEPGIGVRHVAVTPDGRRALVTRDGDSRISVLRIDGDRVAPAQRDISAGLRPQALAISPTGEVALVANAGRGDGDADTISLIDLTQEPYRVVDTVSVGQTPVGVAIAPNGRLAAAMVVNGSDKPKASPFHAGTGKVVLLRVKDKRLVAIDEAPVGAWPRSAAFSADSRMLLVGTVLERSTQLFRVEHRKLVDTRQAVTLPGGSAALRTADFPPTDRPAVAQRAKKKHRI